MGSQNHSPEGWLKDDEADALRAFAHGRVLEVGTFKGLSASVMAPICDQLWCVDPHCEFDGLPPSWSAFLDYLATEDIKNVIPVRMTLESAILADVLPSQFDYVYIDGDHRFQAVSYDLLLASCRCATVSLHDYGQGGSDVQAVVDKFLAERESWKILDLSSHLVTIGFRP